MLLAPAAFLLQGNAQRRRDRIRDFLLDLEDVLQFAVELARPHVKPVLGVDQLGGDAQPVAGFPHTAFDTVWTSSLRPISWISLPLSS